MWFVAPNADNLPSVHLARWSPVFRLKFGSGYGYQVVVYLCVSWLVLIGLMGLTRGANQLKELAAKFS